VGPKEVGGYDETVKSAVPGEEPIFAELSGPHTLKGDAGKRTFSLRPVQEGEKRKKKSGGPHSLLRSKKKLPTKGLGQEMGIGISKKGATGKVEIDPGVGTARLEILEKG